MPLCALATAALGMWHLILNQRLAQSACHAVCPHRGTFFLIPNKMQMGLQWSSMPCGDGIQRQWPVCAFPVFPIISRCREKSRSQGSVDRRQLVIKNKAQDTSPIPRAVVGHSQYESLMILRVRRISKIPDGGLVIRHVSKIHEHCNCILPSLIW